MSLWPDYFSLTTDFGHFLTLFEGHKGHMPWIWDMSQRQWSSRMTDGLEQRQERRISLREVQDKFRGQQHLCPLHAQRGLCPLALISRTRRRLKVLLHTN